MPKKHQKDKDAVEPMAPIEETRHRSDSGSSHHSHHSSGKHSPRMFATSQEEAHCGTQTTNVTVTVQPAGDDCMGGCFKAIVGAFKKGS